MFPLQNLARKELTSHPCDRATVCLSHTYDSRTPPYDITCTDAISYWRHDISSAWHSNSIPMSYGVVNSAPSRAAYMRQWIASALIQIMLCRLFGANPISKSLLGYCQLYSKEQTSVLQWNFNQSTNFSFTKVYPKISSAKWRPFCPGKMGQYVIRVLLYVCYSLSLSSSSWIFAHLQWTHTV